MNKPLRNFLIGISFLGGLFVVAVTGYYLAGWSLLEAVYMVILTFFSVGYSEVRPIDSPGLVLFTTIVIVLGCSNVIYIMGAFFQLLTEGQIQNAINEKRMNSEIKKLTDHVIICGYGRVGQCLSDELADAGRDFIIIESDPTRCRLIADKKYAHLVGDATDEDLLTQAGIKRADTLASVLSDDAANVFITLSARNMNKDLRIIARGDYPSTEAKLIQAGADKAILPTLIGADRLAGLVLRPNATEYLEEDGLRGQLGSDLQQLGVQMHEIALPDDSDLIGSNLAVLETRGRSAFLVVCVKRHHGEVIHKPALNTELIKGDTLIVMCYIGSLPELSKSMTGKVQYRGSTI